jgi:hypothetical protein
MPQKIVTLGAYLKVPQKAVTFRGISIKSAPKGCYLLEHFFKMPQNPSN